MQTELEKLDEIRSRVKVSYEEAKEALDRSGGDVVAAVISLEKQSIDLASLGVEVLDDIQKLLEGGATRKVRVKFGNALIKEYPVAFGAAAAIAVGILAILISKATIEIDREEAVSEITE